MPQILVCTQLDDASLDILRQGGDVHVHLAPTPDELLSQIDAYQAIVVDGDTRVGGRLIETGYNLRAIGRVGSRLDNIDVSAARAMGVEVCYSPSSSAVAVAEQTFALMLSLVGRETALRPATAVAAPDTVVGGLAGRTLGLIGFGRISRQVARRARAFEMQVLVNQPRLTPELALAAGAEVLDLPDLLRQSDIVSLHVPYKSETAGMIDAAALGLMRPDAYLINTAHPGLVDEAALLAALESERLAGAAVLLDASQAAERLRRQPSLIEVELPPHVHIDHSDAAASVARQLVEILRIKRPDESLSLELVPIEQVMPHEQVDDKRVDRLMDSLAADRRLVNPPLVTNWNGRYIVMDGATRFTALKRLGYPHMVVQVVDPGTQGFALHTWYHAICNGRPLSALVDRLDDIDGLSFEPLPNDALPNVFQRREDALCYFLGGDGGAALAAADPDADRLQVMNALVARYTEWGDVERTLLTDLSRLLAQFPKMTAVAIFPQFSPSTVFDVAARGDLLPAGLTRFVIPGRILRLNVDLERLKADEPLPAKRAWFNQFLQEKLARSRLRYYQEPVILLDE